MPRMLGQPHIPDAEHYYLAPDSHSPMPRRSDGDQFWFLQYSLPVRPPIGYLRLTRWSEYRLAVGVTTPSSASTGSVTAHVRHALKHWYFAQTLCAASTRFIAKPSVALNARKSHAAVSPGLAGDSLLPNHPRRTKVALIVEVFAI